MLIPQAQRLPLLFSQSCPTLGDPLVQHARLPCPSPSPRVCSNSCSLTISSSATPFSFYPQSFPASGSFQWVGSLYQWPKYWSFTFSVSTSTEYSGLISSRIDWFDLLVVQGPLKSLLQHYNLKESILWHSAFFMVQLSHPYVTTGTTVALTRWTFVSIMMSLLLNTLSRLVTAFLSRSKCLELFNFKNPHYFCPLPHTFWSF